MEYNGYVPPAIAAHLRPAHGHPELQKLQLSETAVAELELLNSFATARRAQ